MGKRLPTTRPMETAGLRWQPETWPMAKAMVRTVRPKAKATPTNPTLKLTPGIFDGKPAARTAVPQPPKTSQKVPKNSAAARLERCMVYLLFLMSECYVFENCCLGAREISEASCDLQTSRTRAKRRGFRRRGILAWKVGSPNP